MNGKERVLAMLDHQPVDCLPLMPITMMFAAAQIGRPYREYATDCRVLAEAQVRVAEQFDFDHVSVISDPAVEAADCGATAQFYPDQPPAIDEAHALLAHKAVLSRLRTPDPLGGGRMTNRVKAVALLKQRVGNDKLVEGWIEGPCAEGADLRGINALMLDFFDDPDFVRELFEFIVALEVDFARVQIEAGADIIGMGDAAASLAGPRFYEEFILPYERRIVAGIRALGARVRLHICGNTRRLLRAMGSLQCDIVDLDFLSPMDEGRARMGRKQVLLGNIDPVRVLRDGSPESVTRAIAECHRMAGKRYIVGAGCEVCRDTPAENLHALRRYAREHGK
jgi:MtaA/CmuA family methyltransferase